MSAYTPPNHSNCVSERVETRESRVCPTCGKSYDNDKRALPAFLAHVAECRDDDQTTLERWTGGATDAEVREAVESMEADR